MSFAALFLQASKKTEEIVLVHVYASFCERPVLVPATEQIILLFSLDTENSRFHKGTIFKLKYNLQGLNICSTYVEMCCIA